MCHKGDRIIVRHKAEENRRQKAETLLIQYMLAYHEGWNISPNITESVIFGLKKLLNYCFIQKIGNSYLLTFFKISLLIILLSSRKCGVKPLRKLKLEDLI